MWALWQITWHLFAEDGNLSLVRWTVCHALVGNGIAGSDGCTSTTVLLHGAARSVSTCVLTDALRYLARAIASNTTVLGFNLANFASDSVVLFGLDAVLAELDDPALSVLLAMLVADVAVRAALGPLIPHPVGTDLLFAYALTWS